MVTGATNRALTVAALMLSLFMGALEMTIVSTAMPTVIGDLGGIHLYSWVFTAYMLASMITVPIYGKLADLYGRKPVILFGLTLFLIGSMASGQARNLEEMIGFRALQGLGAGAMQPISMTIVGDMYTVEQRAKMQGLFGSVWGLASIIGPVVGGFIVDNMSWRWIFYINVPFGIAAMGILFFFFHENVEKRDHRLDIAGAFLLTGAVVSVLAAGHDRQTAYVAGPLGVLFLMAFIYVERRAPEPLLPITLFTSRIMAIANSSGAFIGAGMIACVTYISLYVQGVLHGDASQAGTVLIPLSIGWPLASAVSGRLLTRVGFRRMVIAGFACSSVAMVTLAMFLEKGNGLWIPRACMFFFGIGLGMSNTSMLIAVQTSVDWKQRGIATAGTMFFRTLGGTLSVGLLGGILAAVLTGDARIPKNAADQLLGPDHGRHLSQAVLEHLSGTLRDGLHVIFWIIAALVVAALLLGFFFPRVVTEKKDERHPLQETPIMPEAEEM